MAEFIYENLTFNVNKDKDSIKVTFLENFYFQLNKEDLLAIGKFKIKKNSISFNTSSKTANNKFKMLLNEGFNNLRSSITNKRAIYIHRNSGIPLIGNISFGLIDRGTNLIEIKPITGCNLNCIYCSVGEGLSSKKQLDFVVEADYILEELKKILEFKQCSIEAHIGTHGEPMLYGALTDLIKGLSEISSVKGISIDTNATLIDKKKVDELKKAGLTRINLSLNSITPKTARILAGTKKYDVKTVMSIVRYISKKMDLIISPIWVPGINDLEIDNLIKFYKKIKEGSENHIMFGLQNFLNYRSGRNPVKAIGMDKFYLKLKELEVKHQTKLILSETDFGIKKGKQLPNPFRKNEVVKANVVADGRMINEKLAAAKNRVISVFNCNKTGSIKIKLIRIKHNVFVGQLIS